MPDEDLMRLMEEKRGNGRDDYPVRAMWNSVLAGIVFQHDAIEKLRRELGRNGQLRFMCGFKGRLVPPAWVYTRFLKTIMNYAEEVDKIFKRLVDELRGILPNFGQHLSIDSKAISSFAEEKNTRVKPKTVSYGKRSSNGLAISYI